MTETSDQLVDRIIAKGIAQREAKAKREKRISEALAMARNGYKPIAKTSTEPKPLELQPSTDWGAKYIEQELKGDSYVYYIGDGNGKVKIGRSKNPWSRCKENKTFNIDLVLLAVERGGCTIEGLRHNQFREEHLALEWFKASPRLKEHIAGLAKHKPELQDKS